MSSFLWKFYLYDDVETFRHLLANAGLLSDPHGLRAIHTSAGKSGGLASTVGSNGGFSMSTPKTASKNRKLIGKSPASEKRNGNWSGLTLTRADLNLKDDHGLTILHYAASSSSQNAMGFATALIDHPLIDLYVQDEENGWTALHRALYFGNVTIARAIMDRDRRDASNHSNLNPTLHPGGIIRIKDKDGNSAFDVFNASITNRDHGSVPLRRYASAEADMEDEWYMENEWSASSDGGGFCYDGDEELIPRESVDPRVNIEGDEVYTFGSNKNFSLGFADEDDRQFPDRVSLERPNHLIRRFYQEYWGKASQVPGKCYHKDSEGVARLPSLIQNKPLVIQDVVLSKLHTAVLTTDYEANLYVCGYGPGGRLGTGDENTRFTFVPIHGGDLPRTRIVSIALGQNHTVASTAEGDVFTWGSNIHGQLGYPVSNQGTKEDDLVQLLPRQVYGPLRRETIVGTAASAIHSVVYTKSGLFTFGKNEGQLGLVDSEARSLEIQAVPRRVGASLFSTCIQMVSAIDRATICLLENHDVWVFANYGYARITFPLHGSTNHSFQQNGFFPRHDMPNYISEITSGGDTICAKSRMGDVYSIRVNQSEPGPSDMSVVNPNRARHALSQPQRIWSLRKGHMAVRDIAVGQDGSIILCTESGSVWRRTKRAKVDVAKSGVSSKAKPKDYKFSRVPGLTGVAAVRCNTFGAYAAVRKDSDILRTKLRINSPSLQSDLFSLLSFRSLEITRASTGSEKLKLGNLKIPQTPIENIVRAVLTSADLASDLSTSINAATLEDFSYNLHVRTSTSEPFIPAHQFMFLGRSPVLRKVLAKPRPEEGPSEISDCITIASTLDGKLEIVFQGFDFLAVLNLVLYIYTDQIIDFWHYAQLMPTRADKFRQIRTELMKLATCLGLWELEQAVRAKRPPVHDMNKDLARAMLESIFWDDADIVVELSGAEMRVHSALVCQRCPFFAGLFKGRAAGKWLSSRRQDLKGIADSISVDLKHVEPDAFNNVLRHLYSDEGEGLLDELVTANLDEFLDVVTEVMSVANELMIERLCQICQKLLGRFVTIRNVCQLLNAVAPCSVTAFKDKCFEYICLNLEGMLENHLLNDLDEELMLELDQAIRKIQLSCLPYAKSDKAETLLRERFPNLVEARDRERRAWINKLASSERKADNDGRSIRSGSGKAKNNDVLATSPTYKRNGRRMSSTEAKSATTSPALRPRNSTADLLFSMDEDDENCDRVIAAPGSSPLGQSSSLPTANPEGQAWNRDELEVCRQSDLGNKPNIDISNRAGSYQDPPAAPTRPAPSSSLGRSTNDLSQLLTTPAGPSTPWHSPVLIPDKLDLKEIMAQTLPTRPSNLSLGISAQADNAQGKALTTFGGKMSQRERKKQQQQAKEQTTSPPPSIPSQSLPEVSATSPWTTPVTGQRVSLKDVLKSEKEASEVPRPNVSPTHIPETKHHDSRKSSATNQAGEAARRIQPRAVSSPCTFGAGAASSLPKIPAQPVSPSPMSPQTSSHPRTLEDSPMHLRSRNSQPRTTQVEPALQLSLADIISQQQAEQEIVRQTVSKRALADIQQEQEFMEWWDAESRKLREEESTRGDDGGKERAQGRGGKRRGKGPLRGRAH